MRNKFRYFIFSWQLVLLMILLLGACKAAPIPTATPSVTPSPVLTTTPTPRPTPTAYVARLEIYPDKVRQTVSHIGSGNFIHYFGGSLTALEPISQMNMDLLNPRFARVRIEMPEWEPVNDDNDPNTFNLAGFIDDRHNRATFELMQILQSKRVEITASVWQVPDWLVENPEDESPRTIARSMYPEAVESIAAWLLHAKEQYGVEVAYVSFNEANLGITIQLSSEDYVEMIRIGGKRFEELGLNTKWLLGDCSSISGCLDYVKPIWAATEIRSYLGPFAFHNWDGTGVPDETIAAIGDWAAQQDLETRCTEGGWDPQLWQRSNEFPTWNNAHRLAISYSRVLKLSRATSFYYWEMMGDDYALNDGQNPYPAMEMLRQMSEIFPPGAQIVETSPNKSNLYFVAAKTPDSFVVHMVNASLKENVLITGLPNGTYRLYRTTSDELNQLVQTIPVRDGTAQFELGGFSVNVLVTTK